MIIHKKTPNGDVINGNIIGSEKAGFTGIMLCVNTARGTEYINKLCSLEGDKNETRLLLNDEVIESLNIKIVHAKNTEEFDNYKSDDKGNS